MRNNQLSSRKKAGHSKNMKSSEKEPALTSMIATHEFVVPKSMPMMLDKGLVVL